MEPGAKTTRAPAAAQAEGLRVDVRADGSLGARVRNAVMVPFVAVLGAREAAADAVSLRPRGGAPVQLPVAEALARIRAAARPLDREGAGGHRFSCTRDGGTCASR